MSVTKAQPSEPTEAEEFIQKANMLFSQVLRKSPSTALAMAIEIAAAAEHHAGQHGIKIFLPAIPKATRAAPKATPAAQRYQGRLKQAEAQLRASGQPLKRKG